MRNAQADSRMRQLLESSGAAGLAELEAVPAAGEHHRVLRRVPLRKSTRAPGVAIGLSRLPARHVYRMRTCQNNPTGRASDPSRAFARLQKAWRKLSLSTTL